MPAVQMSLAVAAVFVQVLSLPAGVLGLFLQFVPLLPSFFGHPRIQVTLAPVPHIRAPLFFLPRSLGCGSGSGGTPSSNIIVVRLVTVVMVVVVVAHVVACPWASGRG